MHLQFAIVDVFARRPLTGNPVTVVPSADDLTTDTMRAVARELAQSETVFVLRPDRPGATWRLRSFTTAGVEVGGAGHHTLGAWIWLDHEGRAGDGPSSRVVQQVGETLGQVEIVREPGAPVRVVQDQAPLTTGPALSAEDGDALTGALGIETTALAGAPRVLSTGVAHLHVPLTDRRAVDAVRADPAVLASVLARVGAEGCYVWTTAGQVGRAEAPHPDVPADAYARFTNPTVGIVEDAATGTAAGPLAAALTAWGAVEPGRPVHVLQGARMGRPSLVRVDVESGRVRVSGSAVVSGSGELRLG